MKNKLTVFIIVGLIAGIATGLALHSWLPSAEARDVAVTVFDTIAHLFLNAIKMVIAPLIFAIIVSGITGMTKAAGIGPMVAKGLTWFLVASVVAGSYGFLCAHALGVGEGLALPSTTSEEVDGIASTPVDFASFVEHVIPTSVVAAMAENNALQILVFGLLFGTALLKLKRMGHTQISSMVEELVPVMLKLTGYVMHAAPVGIFAAVASSFTAEGTGSFAVYGGLIANYYATLAGLWVIMLTVAAVFLGRTVLRLITMVREPMFIAFSTSSSEAAFPKLIAAMTGLGVSRRTTGFILPMGYSFNLDGSMMYMTFASVFLINAYGVEIDLAQQIAMVMLLLVSSKGMAGVPRGALVIVAAVVPSFGVPIAGIAVLLVVDQILDMGRTATNILGNAIATAVLARKELRAPNTGLKPDHSPEEAPAHQPALSPSTATA